MESDKQPIAVIYTLRVRDDGSLQFNLSNAHKAWLKYLAANGGEVVIDWDHAEKHRSTPIDNRRETIREHMANLNRMAITAEVPLLTSEHRCLVRLTDVGRNIVAAIYASEAPT